MNNKWRTLIPVLQPYIVRDEKFNRDPFCVVIIELKIPALFVHLSNPEIITGVGVSKRNRYAKSFDKPDYKRGLSIANDRAYKDIYKSLKELAEVNRIDIAGVITHLSK